VLPLRDNIPTRTAPVLTVLIIVATVLVWILYELPDLEGSINQLAFHPCEVDGSCPQVGQDWPLTAFTAMFMHGSWMHLIGNMLFLWIFGNNVEDTLGRVRFLIFYVAGGLAATATQTVVTLGWGSEFAATIPNVGASGAIAAVLGAYILLHPRAGVLTWIFPIFFLEIPAFAYLGIWFLFQLLDGSISFTAPDQGGGVAYFAHVGGFAFGFLVIRLFMASGPRRREPVYRA